jgi:hypothetical protein
MLVNADFATADSVIARIRPTNAVKMQDHAVVFLVRVFETHAPVFVYLNYVTSLHFSLRYLSPSMCTSMWVHGENLRAQLCIGDMPT